LPAWRSTFPKGLKGCDVSTDDEGGTLLGREPDYGAADYMRLPESGIRHYHLTDAGLLAALDIWASGNAPGVPCEDWRERDDPKIRAALDPLREQLVAALVRSVEGGQLAAEIRGRNLTDSRLIPERTFVELRDLGEWMELHGHEPGDVISGVELSLGEHPWHVASEVAENRARFRLAHLDPEDTSALWNWPDRALDLEGMKEELRAKRLHIVHLEQQLHVARGGSGGEKHLSTRHRRTLLIIIAALCSKAGIDRAGRGAAMAIASATEDLGVPVGDDSIRVMLREIPDAIESRSR